MTEINNKLEFERFLIKLKKQFLCCYPLHCIEWQCFPKNLTWDQQEQVVANTYGHPLNQQQPIKLSYQLNFLKRLIQVLEEDSDELHDTLYEALCKLQRCAAQDATQKYAYKHYLLPEHNDATKFTLREWKSFVAEGTTGLCSWQASLALADYLLHHSEIVRDKVVVEMGAGTGLCGFVITHCCGVDQMVLTDGSHECVQLMRENVLRNFTSAKENQDSEGDYCFNIGAQSLAISQFSWNEVEKWSLSNTFKPDVLLAADVIYDDSVFDDLANAINYIFNGRQNRVEMFLAATVRNENTLNKFLHILENLKFNVEEQKGVCAEESYLYWDRTTPVKILKITKQ